MSNYSSNIDKNNIDKNNSAYLSYGCVVRTITSKRTLVEDIFIDDALSSTITSKTSTICRNP